MIFNGTCPQQIQLFEYSWIIFCFKGSLLVMKKKKNKPKKTREHWTKVLYLLSVEQGFEDGIISTSIASMFFFFKYKRLSQHQHSLISGLSHPQDTTHGVTQIKAVARDACKVHWKKSSFKRSHWVWRQVVNFSAQSREHVQEAKPAWCPYHKGSQSNRLWDRFDNLFPHHVLYN